MLIGSELLGELRLCRRAQNNAILWGPPGIGKSALVQQASKLDCIGYRSLVAPQHAPEDIRGVPYPDVAARTTEFFTTSEIPREGAGYLVIEELCSAEPSTQIVFNQLLYERRVGQTKLPDGWMVVATSNRQQDDTLFYRSAATTRSRVWNVEVEADYANWRKWAVANNIDAHIVDFLRQFNAGDENHFCRFDPRSPELTYPLPRTWALLSNRLAIDSELPSIEVIAGYVGNEAATKFRAYTSIWSKMPDLDKVIAGEDPPIIKDRTVQYATVTALVSRIGKSMGAAEFDPVLAWVAKRIERDISAVFFFDLKQTGFWKTHGLCIIQTDNWAAYARRLGELIIK